MIAAESIQFKATELSMVPWVLISSGSCLTSHLTDPTPCPWLMLMLVTTRRALHVYRHRQKRLHSHTHNHTWVPYHTVPYHARLRLYRCSVNAPLVGYGVGVRKICNYNSLKTVLVTCDRLTDSIRNNLRSTDGPRKVDIQFIRYYLSWPIIPLLTLVG